MVYVNSFGFTCYSQWGVSTDSIGIFALCFSQWVAYLGFVGLFCYSQCVVCTDPLTLCVLAVGALHGSICFRLVLLVLFVLPVGGLGVASGGGLTQFLLLLSFLFFPFSTARLGSSCLAASRTQGLCAFLWGLLRFRGEHNGKLIDSYADYSLKSTRL